MVSGVKKKRHTKLGKKRRRVDMRRVRERRVNLIKLVAWNAQITS